MIWLLIFGGLGLALASASAVPQYALSEDCEKIELEEWDDDRVLAFAERLGDRMRDAVVRGVVTIGRYRATQDPEANKPIEVDTSDPYLLALVAYVETVPDRCWQQAFTMQRHEHPDAPGEVIEEFLPATPAALTWYFRLVIIARVLVAAREAELTGATTEVGLPTPLELILAALPDDALSGYGIGGRPQLDWRRMSADVARGRVHPAAIVGGSIFR